MSETPAPSSIRNGIIAAVLIVLAGFAGMAFILLTQLAGAADRMWRTVVPGQADFRFDAPGTYTIFHEYLSTLDGRVYSAERLPGLQILVRPIAPAGPDLVLHAATGSRYRIGERAGRSLYVFDLREPGTYRLAAVYGDGRKQPQTVLAIDRGFVGRLLGVIGTALGVAFASIGIAAAILIMLVRRRRRLARQGPTR